MCQQCQGRIRRHLAEIPEQFRELDATPGANPGGSRISGSKEQALGVRVGVLDLIVPASLATVTDEFGDQIGAIPVITRLDGWVTDWRVLRDQRERQPAPTVHVLSGWLSDRLDWACKWHPAVDDFAAEMKEIIGALYAANGHVNSKPEHKAGVPCKSCDLMTLYRAAGSDYIECSRCGLLLTPDEYDRWVGMLAAAVPKQRNADAAV